MLQKKLCFDAKEKILLVEETINNLYVVSPIPQSFIFHFEDIRQYFTFKENRFRFSAKFCSRSTTSTERSLQRFTASYEY